MTRVATGQLRDGLDETLRRVTDDGERVVVEKDGRPVAAIVSMEDLGELEGAGIEAPPPFEDGDLPEPARLRGPPLTADYIRDAIESGRR